MTEVGEVLIYRPRDYSPSERVRVVEIDTRKKAPRYVVEFLDGENAGTQENVPGGRLRGPWVDVERYDALMANWERIGQVELTDPEQSAVDQVFELLIPEGVAECDWSPVRNATCIHDRRGFKPLIGITVDDLLNQTEGFELVNGDTMLSPDGTLMVAEYACRLNPMPVLEWVLKDEEGCRERSKRGRPAIGFDKRTFTTSPEWEYQWYLERRRPVHELLRSWCGQRAATLQERLGTAEAENRRLNKLLTRIFEELKRLGHSQSAEHLIRAYEEERITPASYRPTIDRPLKPSETPIRYVKAPRRWGH